MLKSLGKFFVSLIIIAITLPLRGYVIVKLWAWFVVPLGVPALAFWHGLGLAFFISYLTADFGAVMARERAETRTFTEQAVETLVIGIITSLIGLAFGWLYHSFM